MPLRKLFALLTVLIAFQGGQKAHSQENLPGHNPWQKPDSVAFEFPTDWQWFETSYYADIEEEANKRANVGFYGTFDRTYLYVTRPETENSYTEGDFGWGNRLDFGYMNESDRGWAMTYWSVTGPNAYLTDIQSRANTLTTDDPRLGGTPAVTDPFGQQLPVRDRNNINFNERVYFVQDSLNVMEMKGIELNRSWRLPSYRKGGILEPMMGIRYISFKDFTRNDDYNVAPGLLLTSTPGTFQTTLLESFTSEIDYNENNLIGGQLGFRYFKFSGRWRNSLDLRAFAMQNFQSSRHVSEDTQTHYNQGNLGDVDGTVQYEDFTSTSVFAHGTEFVFGFDLRAETSYQVFRDVNIRAGFQAIDFAQGILRGEVRTGGGPAPLNRISGTTARSDQNVWLAGLTFGVEINR